MSNSMAVVDKIRVEVGKCLRLGHTPVAINIRSDQYARLVLETERQETHIVTPYQDASGTMRLRLPLQLVANQHSGIPQIQIAYALPENGKNV